MEFILQRRLKKAILALIVFSLAFLLTGCFYTAADLEEAKEEAYEQGYEDAIDDDNPYSDEEYERLADEGDFEDIDNYLGAPYEYDYVYITPTGHCYHMIDCETLENTLYVKAYTLGNTPEGYTECPYCQPWQYE